MKVGDVHVTEHNIHAGTKYMDLLMAKYFPDAHFSEGNRPLFAFASYNAGPGNIARMRTLAANRGLDPVVQQRRAGRRREDRDRDYDLRAQYLQVLRHVQAHARGAGNAAQGARRAEEGGARRG